MSTEKRFASVIAPYIEGLITEKRALGFLYGTEEPILKRFDTYCVKHRLKQPEITKGFLAEWLEQSPTEGSSNHAKRISVVRQLMIYMASLGVSVYIPNRLAKVEVKLPYIMTAEERKAFFSQVDAYNPAGGGASYRRLAQEYKVLFRMIYCCGLRNSEACGIASEKVNLDTGSLTITHSKGEKDRIVYMADDLSELCARYLTWLQRTLGFSPDWFFPSNDPTKPLVNTSVDRVFNRFWNATAFTSKRTDKPVVHDMRFGFITDRVNRWALDGVDVETMMPYLSRYVGHRNLQSTYYYIHTSEQLRDVIAAFDITGLSAIPKELDYDSTQYR